MSTGRPAPLAVFAASARGERALGAWIVIVLTIVTAVAVAAPAALADAEAASLRHALESGAPSARRLAVRIVDDFRVGSRDERASEVVARLAEVDAELDPAVVDRFGAPRTVADSIRFRVDAVGVRATDDPSVEFAQTALPTHMTLRVMPDLDEHSELVDGRRAAPVDEDVNGLGVLEVELSQETAAELGWAVGEQLALSPDTTDPLARQFSGSLPPGFIARVVGIRALDPPDDPFWFSDRRLHRPVVDDTAIGAELFAFATIHLDQLPARPYAESLRSPMFVEQRRDLTPSAIDRDNAQATLDAIVGMQAAFAEQPSPTRPGVVTTLGAVLAAEQAQRRTARTTLTVATAGLIGVALATTALICSAIAARRRPWLNVARARGARLTQTMAAGAVEMAVVGAIAGALGWLAAAALKQRVPGSGALRIVAAIVAGAMLVAAGTAAIESGRSAGAVERPTPPNRRRARTVAAAAVAAIGVASVATFRRRGIATDAPDVDVLVVVLPVLVPLAIAIAAQRLIRAALARVGRRGLRLPPGRLIGLRRGAETGSATIAIVALISVALSFGALGVAIFHALDRGVVDASWRAVGAPFRVTTRDEDLAAALAAIPDVSIAATGSTRISATHRDTAVTVQLISIDVAIAQRVTEGTVADPGLPDTLESADPDGTIPIVAAARINGERVRVGEVLQGIGNRNGQNFRVVATRDDQPFGRRDSWIVADRGLIAAASGREPTFNTLAVAAPDSARGRIESIVVANDDTLEARRDYVSALRADPLGRSIRIGYLVAAALALAVALVGLATVVSASARQRTRDISILGLLGAERRDLVSAIVAEILPATVVAVAIGTLSGWAVVELFDGRYDLSAFSDDLPVALRTPPLSMAAAAAAVTIVAGLMVMVIARRVAAAEITAILRTEGVG